MTCYLVILGNSDTPPWLALVWVLVFAVIFVIRILAAAGKKAAAPRPPVPIPPTLFANVQAGRAVAPPPIPRRPRKVVGPPPPPPPRARTGAVMSDFPEARASVSGAQTAMQAKAASLPGSSILAELRSRDLVRSAIVLAEVVDQPASLREGTALGSEIANF